MIYTYNDFLLLEIYSDVNKQYTEDILNLYNNGHDFSTIDLNNIRLPLKNISIMFFKSNKKKSLVIKDKGFIKDKFLNNIILKFYFPTNISQIDIKQEISHEIGHIQEYYDKLLRKDENLNKDNKESNHIIINKILQDIRDKNKDFFIFCDIIYNTTSDELNEKISSLYQYLKSFDIKDKDQLSLKYKSSNIGKKIEEIKKLDFIKLCDKIQFNINNDSNVNNKKILFELINDFNESYMNSDINHIYSFMNNKIDPNNIEQYFKDWSKVILKNIQKFEKKINYLIVKVITDIHHNENYDNMDIDYTDYLSK
jgi:hypothetical protein